MQLLGSVLASWLRLYPSRAVGPSFKEAKRIHSTVDGQNPAPLGIHWKPWIFGIYRGVILPGLLWWCEMDFVHPQYQPPKYPNFTSFPRIISPSCFHVFFGFFGVPFVFHSPGICCFNSSVASRSVMSLGKCLRAAARQGLRCPSGRWGELLDDPFASPGKKAIGNWIAPVCRFVGLFVCFNCLLACLLGLAWLGLAWLGLAWLGLAWPGLALPCLALPCLALPCLALPCLALPCLPCLLACLLFVCFVGLFCW